MSEPIVRIIPYCRICDAEPTPALPDRWGQCMTCKLVTWLCDWCDTCERCECVHLEPWEV